MRLIIVIVVVPVLLAALSLACGDESAGSSRGTLIVSRADAIVEYDIDGGRFTPLITPDEPNTFVFDAAVSPDGTRIAYIVQPPSEIVDGVYDAGSDLWIAARDGTGARLVLEHLQPNALIRFPRWRDDSHVLAIVQELDAATGTTSIRYTLQEIAIESGDRRTVIGDALAFGISPDGSRIVYARLSPLGGEELVSVATDGTGETILVEQGDPVGPFAFPRFSPDGTEVAFVAPNQPPGGAADSRWPAAGAGKHASPLPDGPPQDLYTIAVDDGGAPRLAAELTEDSPSLAWSDDGRYVYVAGALALYRVDLSSGAVERLGEGIFHAQIDFVS